MNVKPARPSPNIIIAADYFFTLSPASQRRRLVGMLQMIQAAITFRSYLLGKGAIFINTEGEEDAGTRFDRLLKKLYGLSWPESMVPKEGKSPQTRKTPRGAESPRSPEPGQAGVAEAKPSTNKAAHKRRKRRTG